MTDYNIRAAEAHAQERADYWASYCESCHQTVDHQVNEADMCDDCHGAWVQDHAQLREAGRK